MRVLSTRRRSAAEQVAGQAGGPLALDGVADRPGQELVVDPTLDQVVLRAGGHGRHAVAARSPRPSARRPRCRVPRRPARSTPAMPSASGRPMSSSTQSASCTARRASARLVTRWTWAPGRPSAEQLAHEQGVGVVVLDQQDAPVDVLVELGRQAVEGGGGAGGRWSRARPVPDRVGLRSRRRRTRGAHTIGRGATTSRLGCGEQGFRPPVSGHLRQRASWHGAGQRQYPDTVTRCSPRIRLFAAGQGVRDSVCRP